MDNMYRFLVNDGRNVHGLLRVRMRESGFKFCDELQPPSAQPVQHFTRKEYEEAPHLRLEGISASSTDHEAQSIGETERENGEHFWSSSGSASSSSEEYLLYNTAEACSRIHAVGLSIYRAAYQIGMPIYPPHYVAFSVGMHPSHMTRVPGLFSVLANSDQQVFILPRDTPPAKYVKVHLIGKQQQQREDLLYYHAVRRVEIRGWPLSGSSLKDFVDQQWSPQQRSVSYDPYSLEERRELQKAVAASQLAANRQDN